ESTVMRGSGWRHDGVLFASTRGTTHAPAVSPARPFDSGHGAGVSCGSVGRFTRNSSTYKAGRLPRVRNVATDSPPMMAIAIGPQNTLRVSGIVARIAVAAVGTTGRARLTADPNTAFQSDIPFAVSCSIWSIRMTEFRMSMPAS